MQVKLQQQNHWKQMQAHSQTKQSVEGMVIYTKIIAFVLAYNISQCSERIPN